MVRYGPTVAFGRMPRYETGTPLPIAHQCALPNWVRYRAAVCIDAEAVAKADEMSHIASK